MNGWQTTASRSLWLLLVFLAGAQGAAAHGGLTMDMDTCKLLIGPYYMHFAGYQPDKRGDKEFCEDIPEVGRTIVVLDAVDDIMRELPIEVTIVREENGEDGETVMHLPAQVYSTGSFTFRHDFPEKGKYVGIVTATTTAGKELVSRFPFSVGYSDGFFRKHKMTIGVVLGALVFGGGLLWYSNWSRRRA